MRHEQKKQVRAALIRYADNYETQLLAAVSLGVSAAVVSQVKNNNWELLSEQLWYNIARQVGFYCGEWQPADTSCHLLLRILLGDAQHYAMTYGIAMGGGLGKTYAATQYTREHADTFYVAGNGKLNRRSFMSAMLEVAGMEPCGTAPEQMEAFVAMVGCKEEPLVIIDNAHLLKDRVLHLVALLANRLAGNAGVVMMGGDELRMRVVEGVRLKKAGFDEIFKTIGRRFITLGSLGLRDVELVCQANGVYDEDVINVISEACGNNLHSVEEMVRQHNETKMAA